MFTHIHTHSLVRRVFCSLSTPTEGHTHTHTHHKPEVMQLLTAGALLCGPGLPVRLFFDIDGVLISSRFFLVNIFRVPLPSIPTSLSLTYSPPTHPRTRHLCVPPLSLRERSVPSRPSFSHGNCLSVFLLPLSHIKPRRLTDRERRITTNCVCAHTHPLCARLQFPQKEEGRTTFPQCFDED